MAAATPQFTIIGSGLAGPLMACYLGRAGFSVQLYDKRSDPRCGIRERARSINLALSVRGFHALREVGVADEILQQTIPMRGRMIHSINGSLTFQPYGKSDSESIHSVSRAALNLNLVNVASQYSNVSMEFEHKCIGIDINDAILRIHDQRSGDTQEVAAQQVIAADGAFSAVRAAMQSTDRFDYAQEYLSHGYKELTLPADSARRFRMEKNALHIWPRRSFMMIALPNPDGSFTCTLFFPFTGPLSFASLCTPQDVREFFDGAFPDAAAMMPELCAEFSRNPTGSLVTIRCHPWHVRDRIVLVGDAAHAVVPFLGQGMNAAFEDCSVLFDCLIRNKSDWERAFIEFESRRKKHVDVLADLCIRNFLEMRDHVGSRIFLLRKKTDVLLSRLLPGWYVPLYTLVSFSRTPYADAVRRAKHQAAILSFVIFLLMVTAAIVGFVVMR